MAMLRMLERSMFEPSQPILYFPEYSKRRCENDIKQLNESSKHDEIHQNKISSSQLPKKLQEDIKKAHYLLKMTIVIPISQQLIGKVRCHGNEKEDVEMKINHICIETKNRSEENLKGDIKDNPRDIGSKLNLSKKINIYKIERNELKLFQITESLGSLVDGVISSLVSKRQKKRITQNSKNDKEFKFSRTINQLHEEGVNILSKGYIFGGYGTKLSHCFGMAPGIHCTHPNSCALYARSSFLTNKMQQILGVS